MKLSKHVTKEAPGPRAAKVLSKPINRNLFVYLENIFENL